MYEMIELKHLFSNKKAQIIVDVLKFEDIDLKLEKALPIFQSVLKKWNQNFSILNILHN